MNNSWQILGVIITVLLFSYGVANLVFQWKIRDYHKKAELMTKKEFEKYCDNCPQQKEVSRKLDSVIKNMAIVFSDIATIKQAMISISVKLIEDSELRDRIISEMMKH